MRLERWRASGIALFGVLALLAMLELVSLISNYGTGHPFADLGMPDAAERVRLPILSAAALEICAVAGTTAMRLLRHDRRAALTGFATGGSLILAGIYEVGSVVTLITQNQAKILLAGLLYGIAGVVAIRFSRRANRAA